MSCGVEMLRELIKRQQEEIDALQEDARANAALFVRIREERDLAIAALRFYANPSIYQESQGFYTILHGEVPIHLDGGALARRALGEEVSK